MRIWIVPGKSLIDFEVNAGDITGKNVRCYTEGLQVSCANQRRP